jgi:uncharacterized protein (TIRG00374 family)
VTVTLLIVGLFFALVAGWIVFFNRDLMRKQDWFFKLPFMNRVEEQIRSLYNCLHYLQTKPRLLVGSLVISFALQIIEVLSVICIAAALGMISETVPLTYFFMFMPIIWVVTMIPISVGGLGVREGVFIFFFAQVGVPSDNAVALSLLYYSYLVFSGVVGGLLFLRASAGDVLRKRFRARRSTTLHFERAAAPAVSTPPRPLSGE